MSKQIKRFLVFMLAAVLLLSLGACGGSGSYQPTAAYDYDNDSDSTQANNDPDGININDVDEQNISGYETPWDNGIDNHTVQGRFNAQNGGYAAAAGNWILFSNPEDNGRLYRMNADDSEVTLLCAEDNVGDICVAGQMVYFSSKPDYSAGKICAYDMRGQSVTQLLGETGGNIQFYDGWLYFLSGSIICRVSAEGGGKQKIYNQNQIIDFQIRDNMIYAVSGSYIWKMDMNGGNFQRAFEQSLYDFSGWDSQERIGVTADKGDMLFFRDYPATFDWENYFLEIDSSNPGHYIYNYYNNYVLYSDRFGVFLVNTIDFSNIEAGQGEKLLTFSDAKYICIVNGWAFCYKTDYSGQPSELSRVQRAELLR